MRFKVRALSYDSGLLHKWKNAHTEHLEWTSIKFIIARLKPYWHAAMHNCMRKSSIIVKAALNYLLVHVLNL